MPISPHRWFLTVALAAALALISHTLRAQTSAADRSRDGTVAASPAPSPGRVLRMADPEARRRARIGAVRSWGYQLQDLQVEVAAASPYDLLVVDATTGRDGNRPLGPAEVARLKAKPDGGHRLVVSYLSIGEAEDYRADYFAAEYMSEDAPEWLGPENPRWPGNRVVAYCHEGWQRTIVGDADGRNVYNSLEASPLARLVEMGFDGVYLDRADVYHEVMARCPEGAGGMVRFIERLAGAARRSAPGFLVILQNAEELLRHPRLLASIDAVAREDLFYGATADGQRNSAEETATALRDLRTATAAGRAVLVIDYVTMAEQKADVLRRTRAEGFLAYIGPRDLGRLWQPGRDF